MIKPTVLELNGIRVSGFRPEVVGCFLCNKKILFLYNQSHDLWQWPQGGIENGENIDEAFIRETTEELGKSFALNCYQDFLLIGDDQLLFPKATQFSRNLMTDKGRPVAMLGKKYFFIVSEVKNKKITIAETEFDDYKWLNYRDATHLATKIYQKGKARITLKSLQRLKVLGLID